MHNPYRNITPQKITVDRGLSEDFLVQVQLIYFA